MSTDIPPVFAGDQPPAQRRPNWVLIVAIVAGLIVLCAVFFCVASPVMVAILGPSVQNTYSELACQTVYPDLTREQCQTWADNLSKNHSQDVTSCSASSNAGTPSAGGDAEVRLFIQCLDAKGFGPKSK